MRTALLTAVHALLNDPRLRGTLDVVRLAAVILLAKAPATSSCVEVKYRDLAGWLGCSISHIGHTVIPALKQAGVVTSITKREAGHAVGVELTLIPLKEAREAGGVHPLALLNVRDLATLLRLCEAVSCPGWAPVDKPETPAGFMADRQGPDAATDRLAMVLLVLKARDNGRVRMASGRVVKGYRRADATVAQLLGCEVADAAPVVDRLVGLGKAELEEAERGRLRIPEVAKAWARARKTTPPPAPSTREPSNGVGTMPPTPDQGACPRCQEGTAGDGDGDVLVLAGDGWAQQSFDDVLIGQSESAFRDQDASESASPQVNEGFDGSSANGSAARLHADHPPVADLSGNCAGDSSRFSGSAVLGCDDLREGARAREDQLGDSSKLRGAADTGNSPLRGEQRKQQASRSSSGRTTFGGPLSVPEDLREALEPLAYVWSRLGRVSTGRKLATAVRLELVRLRGAVGQERAQQALACRLRRRLDRQGSRPIQDLVGWLLQRGLPHNPECWSTMCDDGVRMDTGGPCESCGCLVGDRRGLRRAVAAEVAACYPQLLPEARRPLYEQELRARVEQQVAHELARREAAACQREEFDRAVQEQKDLLRQQEEERAASPCLQCGEPQAAKTCPFCAFAAQTQRLVDEAVDIVLAMRADLDDRDAVAALAEQVERDTWTVVRKVGDDIAAGERVARLHVEYERARVLLAQRRRKALASLAGSSTAQAEAQHVRRMVLSRTWPETAEARDRAELRAAEASWRVAYDLLAGLLSDLHRCRATVSPDPRPWRERLDERMAEIAERNANLVPEPTGAP
ncbi:hypothetical protein ABZ851_30550 [Streptomyces sp. NPDC047049]|uniref:hypothetical protein n=1 Tax=Streptomyces sp. NPDC047049 TaxID=3156688 RepID=UPI0033FD5FB8